MKYLSVCSGIEAATVAWHPLGWQPVAFSEIDRFPCAVLENHYPSVPNWGDMTKFEEWPDAAVDLLVGGTPCQSFSVAGLRGGLADPRGSLMLTYLAIARRYRPRWVVWENVPGALSIDDGRAFGALLGGLAVLGYGFAYRVLDAQYIRVDGFARAVPQRRRRVFVVGYFGDWRPAAAVLLERQSLSGNPAPRREARQSVAGAITASTGKRCPESDTGQLIAFGGNNTTGPLDVATACRAKGGSGHIDFESETFVAHTLRSEGFDASEDGTGRGIPLVPSVAPTLLAAGNNTGGNRFPGMDADSAEGLIPTLQPVAFDLRGREGGSQFEGPHDTANLRAASGGSSRSYVAALRVRRLIPRECERLQGFDDDYTLVSFRGKPAADGPRYKSLGNSMAVNVMRWLGYRIAAASSASRLVA